MAGLGDLSEDMDVDQSSDTNTSSSSSSGSSSSSDGEYPYYKTETPFMAVVRTEDGLVVRNRPDELSITYRQYSATSDMKKWEQPDQLKKYWMTDWMFKRDRYAYEKEYPESEFLVDLREDTSTTLDRLRLAKSQADPNSPQASAPKCAVCKEELDRADDEYERVLGKKVHTHHTVRELASEGVVGKHKSQNRRWD